MKLNQSIKTILKIYGLALTIFTIFRIILFFVGIDKLGEANITTIFQSFVMGMRFDIVVIGYILLIPSLFILVLDILNKKSPRIKKFVFYFIFVFFTIAFMISAADVPYFNHFFERFSVGAFEWVDNVDFVISMITEEPKYFMILIPFLIVNTLFFIVLKKIFSSEKTTEVKVGFKVVFSITLLLLMFIGIRGRLARKSPIRVGTAYFSENAFLNKLGLNPTYTFLRSYLDSKKSKNQKINLMDSELAIQKVQSYLDIKNQKTKSPIARQINFDSARTKKPNVVIVIMESMSAAKMTRYGNPHNLTPFLDSLATKSIYFDNFYSAGKHTFNGIFSTLYSYPALYRRHSMKQMVNHDGISTVLKKNGYSTTYFTTHDGQFDNVEGFLRANDFQKIVTQSDYPLKEVKTTLGVPDDYLFRYSISILNELANKKKPFFSTFMTASDHGPFYIPEYFTPKNKEIENQIVEYADWSLRKFMKLCSEQEWYDNTIFVFLADHGASINPKYDLSLNYFHIPMLIYAPKLLGKPRVYDNMASQIDVFPTLMGLLKYPYVNNTLGIDVINQKREFVIVNDDDKIGILNKDYLCILKDNQSKLYKYKDKDTKNCAEKNPILTKKMVEFAKANLQVYQDMLTKKQTSLDR